MHIGQENSAYAKKPEETERARIMLVKKREKNKIIAASKISGQTVVPLELYWNKRGLAKILCAIVVGKTNIDKRETIKKREWERQKHDIFINTNKI
jgi:SsrA-binding protein